MPDLVPAVLGALFIIGVLNAVCFARHRVVLAWWLLLVVSLGKVAIVLQDYRLIMNQHYMACWVTAAFLVVPHRRRVLKYLIILFYLWAGLLKINPEWVSGAALLGTRPLGLPTQLLPAACVYVIILELIGVLGLMSRRPWLFWLCLAQLILFHVASFWSVGFFYPLLMFLILSLFVLDRYLGSTGPAAIGPRSLLRGREAMSTYAVVAAFCIAQLPPLMLSGDPAITGEGRLFALHMFDAPVECHARAVLHYGTTERIVRMSTAFLNARIACDPIVYFSLAREHCSGRPDGEGDFDLFLDSRRGSSGSFQSVVSIHSFCATAPQYSIWHHNRWINPVRAMSWLSR